MSRRINNPINLQSLESNIRASIKRWKDSLSSYLIENKDQIKHLFEENEIDMENEKAVKSFLQFQGQDKVVRFLNDYPITLEILQKQIGSMF